MRLGEGFRPTPCDSASQRNSQLTKARYVRVYMSRSKSNATWHDKFVGDLHAIAKRARLHRFDNRFDAKLLGHSVW